MESGGKRKFVSQGSDSNNEARPSKKGGAKSGHVQNCVKPAPQPSMDTSTSSKSMGSHEFTEQHGSKFQGKLVNDIIFVEICAGSARLTRAARDAGFKGIAVDHTDRRSCGIDICIFELEDQSQVDDLCQFLEAEADNIAAVWIAPSCGTASKARERRLPQLKKTWHSRADPFEIA